MTPNGQVQTPTGSASRVVALCGSLICALLYLKWAPLSPDLAAQVARANIVRAAGVSSWWTGWFGGMLLPNYSVITPSAMALLGVRATGLLAATVTIGACRVLTRGTLRPRAALLACSTTTVADLLNGRVTFVLGFAVGTCALASIVRGSREKVLVAPLTLVTYLASPLAGLFLGLILVAIALTDSTRRWSAVISCALLLCFAGLAAVFFPGTGTMPFSVLDAVPAALCCLAVAVACPRPVVRVSALVTVAALGVFLIAPGAVGANITRLAWVAAIPAAVACGRLPKHTLAIAVLALGIWPLSDLGSQLYSAQAPSSQSAFYSPLLRQLHIEQSQAGVNAVGQRIEVIDTVNHWASVYLAAESLARGWDRQADNADNPLFYRDGSLNSTSYHQWLNQLAVGWVAIPSGPLDYASTAEKSLVQQGQSYLKITWSNSDWTLYRVRNPAPFATGAMVRAVKGTSIDFVTTGSISTIHLSLRWSPYLSVADLGTGLPVDSCIFNDSGFVQISVAQPGSYELASHFQPQRKLSAPDVDCRQDLGSR